ncbi:hypothetical protein BC834DRAFT_974600 [Gloeopeniophorella convolvens]|nr:hypothetical protein BC834DRAFT_974600 [Gloeopeniophorella convolvens]
MLSDLQQSEESLRQTLRGRVAENVANLFPSLDPSLLSPPTTVLEDSDDNSRAQLSTKFAQLEQLYGPTFSAAYRSHYEQARFDSIKDRDFQSLKRRVIFTRHLIKKHPDMSEDQRSELLQALLSQGDMDRVQRALPHEGDKKPSGVVTWALQKLFTGSDAGREEALRKEMKDVTANIPDVHFLLELKADDEKDFEPAIHRVESLALSYLQSSIDFTVTKLTHNVLAIQQEHFRKRIQREIESKRENELKVHMHSFGIVLSLNLHRVFHLDQLDVERSRSYYYGHNEYKVTGRRNVPQEPKVKLHVHRLDVSSDDRHNMRLETKHIPHPTVDSRFGSEFCLPIGVEISYETVN